MAFPLPKEPKLSCESIVRGEQGSLSDIIHQARELSFMMQHDIVSCQLSVTIAPVQTSSGDETIANYKEFDKSLVCNVWEDMGLAQDGDKVLGTYAFGLQRMSGQACDILIQPEVTTSILLRSVLLSSK